MTTRIGNALYLVRNAAQLTMREVSRLSGFSMAYVCKVENGPDLPSPEYLAILREHHLAPLESVSDGMLREDLLARWKVRGKP